MFNLVLFHCGNLSVTCNVTSAYAAANVCDRCLSSIIWRMEMNLEICFTLRFLELRMHQKGKREPAIEVIFFCAHCVSIVAVEENSRKLYSAALIVMVWRH